MASPKLKYAIGNSASTTLASGITNTDTTATLSATTNFDDAPVAGEGMVLFDEGEATEELAYSTGLSGSAISIPLANRGLEGGSAQAHSATGSIRGPLTAGMWNDLITSLLNVFTQSTGAVDGTKVMKITSTDGQLATGGNIQVNSADPKRTIYVPASAMYPSTTAGCASLTQVESSTNKVNIKVLDFDGAGSSKESAEFGIQSPSYWDASTVTAQFIWYATAGSGTVNWELQGGAFSDDDALDAAYGTLQEVTDTLLATGDVHITAETSAITIAGTPVAGDWLQFRVNRDPANDTNTSDARLLGVRIRFGVKQFDDQ